MKPSNVNYAPLPTNPDEDGKEVYLADQVAQKQALNNPSAIWILLGCVACTLTSLLLAGFALPVAKRSIDPPSGDTNLPRPNQYIGLDVINYDLFKFDPIVNFPPILTQVCSEHPNYVFPDDSRRWLSWIGGISPDDRHFLINSTVSSIAQFRVLDYKMESCQVAINIPSPEEMLQIPPPITGAPGNKSDFVVSPSDVKVQVWKLSAKDDLHLNTLSWNTRPPREKLVDTLTVSRGRLAMTSPFPCLQDSLQTFEFACDTGSDCVIDLWQDKKEPKLAMYILQSSTH